MHRISLVSDVYESVARFLFGSSFQIHTPYPNFSVFVGGEISSCDTQECGACGGLVFSLPFLIYEATYFCGHGTTLAVRINIPS